MSGTLKMKTLQERLTQKEREFAVLQAEIALLKSLMAELSGEPLESSKRLRSPRSSVKTLVLELLGEVKEAGLNAALAVETAGARGTVLDRGSVSSLLSRLKDTGLLTYDGRVYRLKEFSPAPKQPLWGDNSGVVQHPASRSAF